MGFCMFEARGCQILQHTFARVLNVTFHDTIAPTKLKINNKYYLKSLLKIVLK